MYAARVPPRAAVVGLFAFVCMAAPGVALLNRLWQGHHSRLEVYVFGSILGLAVSRLCLTALGLIGMFHPVGILSCLAGLVVVAWALRPRGVGQEPAASDETDASNVRLICVLAAGVFLAVAVAFAGVGRSRPDGFAFVPYFDRDYLNHVALTAELARSIPPQNPYFAGELLHSYWLYHIYPAAIVALTGVPATEAIDVALIPTVGLFVAAVFLWARPLSRAGGSAFAAVAVALFAYSYVGVLLVIKLLMPDLARHIPLVSHADYSFLSHSWFRDFLYEPHAVTCLSLLLLVLTSTRSGAALRDLRTATLTGFILGVMLVTDAFIGLTGLLWFATAHLATFLRDPAVRRRLLAAAAGTVVVLGTAVAGGIFPGGSRSLKLALHPVAKLAPAYLLVELGPLFILGAVGVVLYRRQALSHLRPALLLLCIALALAFLLKVPAEPNIALRKAIKVAQVPLIAFAAITMAALTYPPRRALTSGAVGLVVLSGVITLATDLAQYLDLVKNRRPPTTYVTRDEMEMLRWVRDVTPRTAVLQVLNPERIFGEGTELLVPGLGQRRTFYGNDEMPAMFQVPSALLEDRKRKLAELFGAVAPEDLLSALAECPPLYLYVDERKAAPARALRALEEKGLAKTVHRSGAFSLHQVLNERLVATKQTMPGHD